MTTPTQTHWPTPTGEPALKHRALELADKVSAEIVRTVELDVMHNDAAALIRRQHALIVQMREALTIVRNHSSVSLHQIELIDGPLTAANDYLKQS